MARPTWQVLTRILAAMAMQPTVDATDCDLTRHADTAMLRAVGVGLPFVENCFASTPLNHWWLAVARC